eukprot:10220421-Lingulodinium_polyedra.AAC.1
MKAAAEKRAKVWFSGILPGVFYGGEVTGFTMHELRDLRSSAASMLRLTGRGGHQALGWALQPARDP